MPGSGVSWICLCGGPGGASRRRTLFKHGGQLSEHCKLDCVAMCSDKEPLTDRNEAHERGAIYKWMQPVVDTSIVHAVLYRTDAAEHRPQQKLCAGIVHVIHRIVLRLSSNRTGARLLSNVLVLCFFVVLTHGLRARNRITNGEAHLLGFTFCGRFSRPFRGLKNGVASRGDCFSIMMFCCSQQRTCE